MVVIQANRNIFWNENIMSLFESRETRYGAVFSFFGESLVVDIDFAQKRTCGLSILSHHQLQVLETSSYDWIIRLE